MLQKINRLTKKKDFEAVFKNGYPLNGDIIFLKFLKNNLDFSRFGFIVSGKVSKKAVIRNKIKRRLREIIRLKIKDIKNGFDIIIIAKFAIIDKEYQEIKEVLNKILNKI